MSFPQPTRARCGPFVELWHPDSPGGRLLVRPSLLRRLGIVRSEFATLGEAIRRDKEMIALYQLGIPCGRM